MKQLSRLQAAIYLIGGALMVIGAGCFAVILWNIDLRAIASWTYLVGAVMFTVMQTMQTYEGKNFVIRRLKRIQGFASLCFLVAGFLMIDRMWGLLRPLFDNDISYLNAIGNKWVLALLIAAILEMYTTTRISSELKKETAEDDRETQD